MRVLSCWLNYSLCVLSLFLILCVAKPCVLISCVLIKKTCSSAGITFDLHKYCDSIRHALGLFPGIDVRKWSLKKEWVEFSKTFFVASRPKERYFRSSYMIISNKMKI